MRFSMLLVRSQAFFQGSVFHTICWGLYTGRDINGEYRPLSKACGARRDKTQQQWLLSNVRQNSKGGRAAGSLQSTVQAALSRTELAIVP